MNPGHDPASTGTIRGAWRHRSFRRLMSALAISQVGDWLYNVALLAMVWEQTSSSTWLGMTTAARVLPIVVLGPLGGVVADRWDRRRTMIASDLVRAGLMLGLVAVGLTHSSVVLVALLAAAATVAAVPYPACVAASTPRLVDDADLAGANALRSVLGPLCIVTGPALGALLLALGPATMAFAVNAGTFLASALAVSLIPAGATFRPSRDRGTSRPSVLDDVRRGTGALAGRPAQARLVGADILCSVVYGVLTVTLLLVSHRLRLDSHGYGYLLAAFGAGGVVGAALAGRLAAGPLHPRKAGGALVAVGLSLPLLAVAPALLAALVCVAAGGAAGVLVEVLTETSLQRSLPEEDFALAYGLAFPASLAGIMVGSLVAPLLVAGLGLTGALTAMGAAVLAYAWASTLRVGRGVVRAPGAALAQGQR